MIAKYSLFISVTAALVLAALPIACFAAPAPAARLSSSEAPIAAIKCPSVYVVRYGETLYSIAARCGVSAAALMRVNALRTTRVWPGQRLYILATTRVGPAPQPTPSIHRAPAP